MFLFLYLFFGTAGQALRKYRGHLSTVNCVKFNEESTVAISGSVDTTGIRNVQVCKHENQVVTNYGGSLL